MTALCCTDRIWKYAFNSAGFESGHKQTSSARSLYIQTLFKPTLYPSFISLPTTLKASSGPCRAGHLLALGKLGRKQHYTIFEKVFSDNFFISYSLVESVLKKLPWTKIHIGNTNSGSRSRIVKGAFKGKISEITSCKEHRPFCRSSEYFHLSLKLLNLGLSSNL